MLAVPGLATKLSSTSAVFTNLDMTGNKLSHAVIMVISENVVNTACGTLNLHVY